MICRFIFDAIVLDILSSMKGERSPSAVYHLLKGKRSSQTIQDAGLFAVSKYFGFCSALSRAGGSQRSTIEAGVFGQRKAESGAYTVTEKEKRNLPAFCPLSVAPPFSRRLLSGGSQSDVGKDVAFDPSALQQALPRTRVFADRKDYQIQNWVKQYLRNRNAAETAAQFHQELKEKLSVLNHDEQAAIFVHSLTSRTKAGYTFRQLSEK